MFNVDVPKIIRKSASLTIYLVERLENPPKMFVSKFDQHHDIT